MTRKEELIALIETLIDDLKNRPAPKDFKPDFVRDMSIKALNKARRELARIEFAEKKGTQ